MTAANEDWTPPHTRPDEVEGAIAEATREKWFFYSKTYQGIACLIIIFFANRYFQYTLPKGEAIIISDFLFTAMAGVATWWTAKGRAQAAALIYWLPRDRKKKLSVATGIPVSRLLTA
jgi:hypothetical protein